MTRFAQSAGRTAVALSVLWVLCFPEAPAAQEATAMFVVTGTVHSAGTPVTVSLDVDVTNVTTGEQKLVRTGEVGEGQYVANYLDMETSRAAAVGDEIVVTVSDAAGAEIGSGTRVLTADDIAAASANINIELSSQVTAVQTRTWGEIKGQW